MNSRPLPRELFTRLVVVQTTLLCLSACSDAKNQTAEVDKTADQTKKTTEVTVVPPVVKIGKLPNVSSRGDKLSPASHEIGKTDWLCSIEPDVDFTIKKEQKEKKGYHLWLEINAVRIKVALPITTTVSDKAPQSVLDHEKGHVEICERVYKDARQVAQAAADAVVGTTVEGFGADYKAAFDNALQMSAQNICAPYRVKICGVTDRVSSNYDQLCEKERLPGSVEKTVEKAFAMEPKSKP